MAGLGDPTAIQLKPYIRETIKCPNCGVEISPSDWHITGMHAMLELHCPSCGKHYFAEIPVNSGLFYPGILDAESGLRADSIGLTNWYLSGLVHAYQDRESGPVGMTIIRNRELGEKPVWLLNTIDATYGHALYELFDASYYRERSEADLVIIVQKNLAWLVPSGAAQVWIVDLPFSRANGWFDDLAVQIKNLLKGVSSVSICRSFVQANSNDFRIEDYTRVKPFPLEEWDARLERPTVTFIWRTDRFWKPVLPRIFDNRYTRKLAPGALDALRTRRQFDWILRFSEAIREQIPDIDFAIAGMDERRPSLPGWIKDFRYPVHEDTTAKLQAERYANSHLIIGCNGSSLLLPGCLSGGVVNIVPAGMWAVSAGTFSFRITDIADTHFRYLMVNDEISIARLVSILVSLLRDRAYVQIQASPPWRDHASEHDSYAWSRFRQHAADLSRFFPRDKGTVSQRIAPPVPGKME